MCFNTAWSFKWVKLLLQNNVSTIRSAWLLLLKISYVGWTAGSYQSQAAVSGWPPLLLGLVHGAKADTNTGRTKFGGVAWDNLVITLLIDCKTCTWRFCFCICKAERERGEKASPFMSTFILDTPIFDHQHVVTFQ